MSLFAEAEAYLRERGWRNTPSDRWEDPSGQVLPIDEAVGAQQDRESSMNQDIKKATEILQAPFKVSSEHVQAKTVLMNFAKAANASDTGIQVVPNIPSNSGLYQVEVRYPKQTRFFIQFDPRTSAWSFQGPEVWQQDDLPLYYSMCGGWMTKGQSVPGHPGHLTGGTPALIYLAEKVSEKAQALKDKQ